MPVSPALNVPLLSLSLKTRLPSVSVASASAAVVTVPPLSVREVLTLLVVSLAVSGTALPCQVMLDEPLSVGVGVVAVGGADLVAELVLEHGEEIDMAGGEAARGGGEIAARAGELAVLVRSRVDEPAVAGGVGRDLDVAGGRIADDEARNVGEGDADRLHRRD